MSVTVRMAKRILPGGVVNALGAARHRNWSFLLEKCCFGTGNPENRHRWVRDALETIPLGTRILNAGAGEMIYKPDCERLGLQYVSQDFCKYDGCGDGGGMQSDSWKQSGIDIVCDIKKIPEDDGAFGAVLCTEVLEHVPSPKDALRELVRVLSPGGTLIATAPFASLSHQSPYYYSTGFSKYWYEHWATEFGLTVLELGFNGNAFSWMAQQLH